MAIPDMMYKALEKDFPHLRAEIRRAMAVSHQLRSKRVVDRRAAIPDKVPGQCEVNTFDAKNTKDIPGSQVGNEESPPLSSNTQAVFGDQNSRRFRIFSQNILGLNGIDGAAGDLNCTTDYKEANAFQFSFEGHPHMVCGNGDGFFKPFVFCRDVVGHEEGHAFVALLAGHRYIIIFGVTDDGAINESHADIIGECFEQWDDGVTVHEASWLMGEHCITECQKAKGWIAIRTFDPNKPAYPGDEQPNHVSERKFRPPLRQFDMGGVHYDSKLMNMPFKAFAVEHGGHYAFEAPLDIFFSALKVSKPFMKFVDVARLTVDCCETRYPKHKALLVDCWERFGHKL